MGFEFLFQVDSLATFMACVSGFVSLLIFIYALGYMREYAHKLEFFGFMFLFLLAMMGLIFSANLLLLYIFWEITAFCSWRLIGFYRKEKDLWYADKAFLLTFFGAALMLAGIILIFLQYNTLNLAELAGKPISNLVFLLFLCGIFAKSAQLPLSSWLPDAGVAPTPVTALLHAAVLVKIGVYAYARLFASGGFVISQEAKLWAMGLVAFSSLVAAMSALRENDIKRILAYSTISQLAYIFLGFMLNTALGISAALLYILVHSLAKAGLFLAMGIVEQKTHIRDLRQLGGLIRTIPQVGWAFLLCAFSIIGLPPFAGFFSKFFLVLATAQSGYRFLAAMEIFLALLTLLYLMRLFNGVFQGEVKVALKGRVPFTMTGTVASCGFLSLLLGIVLGVLIMLGRIGNFL
jgi:NADH:ubiquinone oxidoreductase subunit 5 (subunit L)/multisubunit Na+/H+ antiporter MnhA subunit